MTGPDRPSPKAAIVSLPDRSEVHSFLSSSPDAPPIIEGFRIFERLGEGGMGSVWRAMQLSTRREVALKLLHISALTSSRARQRFDREVELTGRLQHPNICRIYESGVHRGVYFYVMELVAGTSLDVHVRQRQLSDAQVLRLFCTICRAVDHAHQKGVIHRDLKPSNIIVGPDGQPHVLDFGLAKTFEVNEGGSAISLEGELAGTPAFMSPEQATGKFDQLDTRTDVYTLGVILYLLLTGKNPHRLEGGKLDILSTIAHDEVIAPRRARPNLDPELSIVLLKALAKAPDDRYGSPGALAEDIDRYLAGDLLLARRPSIRYLCAKKLRKHLVPVLLALFAAMSIIAGIGYAALETAKERDRAIEAAARERSQRRLADLQRADNLVSWGHSLTSESKLVEAAAKYWESRRILTEYGIQPTEADIALTQNFQNNRPPILRLDRPGSVITAAAIEQTNWIVRAVTHDGLCSEIVPWSLLQPKTCFDAKANLHGGQFGESGDLVALVINSRAEISSAEPAIEVRQVGDGRVWRRVSLPGVCRRYAFSSDLRFAACVVSPFDEHETTQLIVFDLNAGTQETLRNSDDAGIPTFSGNVLGVAYANGELSIRDLLTKSARTMNTHVMRPTAVALAPHQNIVLIASAQGMVEGLTIDSAKSLFRLAIPGAVTNLTISGSVALAASSGGAIRCFDIASGDTLPSLRASRTNLRSLASSANQNILIATYDDGQLDAWMLKQPASKVDIVTGARNADITADGRLAAIGCLDGSLILLDARTSQLQSRQPNIGPAITSLRFVPNGKSVLYGTEDGRIRRWDIASQTVTEVFDSHVEGPSRVHISRDGGTAVISSIRGSIIWDIDRSAADRTLETGPAAVAGLSHDGRHVCAVRSNGEIVMYDRKTQMRRSVYEATLDHVVSAMVRSDGEVAYVATSRGMVAAINVTAGSLLWQTSAHRGRTFLDLSSDNRFLLTAATDGEAKAWAADTGRLVSVLSQQTVPLRFTAIDSNSNAIILGGENSASIRILDLNLPVRAIAIEQSLKTHLDPTSFDQWRELLRAYN